jgi:protocatechuate 3,4-dioxygenase beta subunit
MSEVRAGRTLAAAAAAALLGAACWAQPAAPPAGAGAPSVIDLAGPEEPGQRLVVSGRVFEPDGATPAAGVTLYVYQTDAEGLYSRSGRIPRLRGWMTTDAEGRYEYRTIRPAPYPSGGIAAHVHTQLWGAGWPKQWNRDLLFADDPYLSARDRDESAAAGRFAWVCAPATDASGVPRCTHDLRLKPTGDRFEPMIEHGSIPKSGDS